MQLVIDGIYVEPGFLMSINPNDVETVEVLRSAGNTAIYGIRGGGGVLIITTKRGERNSSYTSYAPGIIDFNPQGFYKGREFYVPNYDDPKINEKIRDLRSTVYWNPSVITDSTGKAVVEFFNADGAGNYRTVIEGIDADGNLGRKEFRYVVE
jgi:TonB-dependent SusC/RagA subfamily outer membrane receptor